MIGLHCEEGRIGIGVAGYIESRYTWKRIAAWIMHERLDSRRLYGLGLGKHSFEVAYVEEASWPIQ